jgi:hypothetical protein
MDRRGVLPAHRTSTRRRYWDKADLDKYLGRTKVSPGEEKVRILPGILIASPAQRPDLKKQRKGRYGMQATTTNQEHSLENALPRRLFAQGASPFRPLPLQSSFADHEPKSPSRLEPQALTPRVEGRAVSQTLERSQD